MSLNFWAAVSVSALLIGNTALLDGHAAAHHAEAAFDHSRVLKASGAVKEFLWANPHTLIYLKVAGLRGITDVAIFEAGPALVMTRNGWSRDSLKVGDAVTIDYYPRRDQKPGGLLAGVTRADGKKLEVAPHDNSVSF